MTDRIEYNQQGNAVAFVGARATDTFRMAALRSAIGLLQQGIKPTRTMTMTSALNMASTYTGKRYKRTEAEQARTDLEELVQQRKAELAVQAPAA